MEKNEKAQIVKAITLLHAGKCRLDEALEILYGLVGLLYPGPRSPEALQEDHVLPEEEADLLPEEEADRLVDRKKWEEVLNV